MLKISTRPLETTIPLRDRRFRLLWVAYFIFHSGHLVQAVAGAWVVLQLTSSPFWVALMTSSSLLLLPVLSLPAGAVADMLDRRRVLVGASLVMASASIAMAVAMWSDPEGPVILVLLAVLLGAGVAFFDPSWQASIPDVVDESSVPDAIALNSAGAAAAWAVGPALGGTLVAVLGPAWALMFAGVGYLTMLCAVTTLPTVEKAKSPTTLQAAVATGIRHIVFSGKYHAVLAVAGLFGLTSASLRALLPNVVAETLAGGSTTYGLLLAAFGCGAIAGALTRRKGSRLLRDSLLPVAVALYGAAGVVIGAANRSMVVALALAVAGVVWTWILATLNATIQLLAPSWARGRAMSVFAMAFFGMLAVGSILAGWLGDAVGTGATLVFCSVGTVFVGLVARTLPIVGLQSVRPPRPAGLRPAPIPESLGTNKVACVTTWTVRESDIDRFLALAAELKTLRLSNGALSWCLYRSGREPCCLTELVQYSSWQEYELLTRRLDTDAARVISRAARLDCHVGPVQRLLVRIDDSV